MERCESDGKSSLDLFKIAIRHCCGKKFFRLYGSFTLVDPRFLPSLSLARAHVLYFRSALPAVSARSWTLGCLRVRSELERKREKPRYSPREIGIVLERSQQGIMEHHERWRGTIHNAANRISISSSFVKVRSSKDTNDVSMRIIRYTRTLDLRMVTDYGSIDSTRERHVNQT